MNINIPNVKEIEDVGMFSENMYEQQYGFTIQLKNKAIINIYVKGNYYNQKETIQELKKKYRNIKNQLNKKRRKK